MTSEALILNKILDTQDYSIISLNNLTEELFNTYKAEFLFIKNHYEQYRKVPDKIVFASRFPDFKFVEVKESDLYLISELLRDYNVGYIAEIANAFQNIYNKNADNTEKIDKAIADFKEAATNMIIGNALTSTNIITDTSRYDRYLERCNTPGEYMYSTGFPELDKLIGGIDRLNEYMVIIGRPGLGKSWILHAMIAACSRQGLRCGLYSGEMTTDLVAYRIDTLLGHMKNSSISRSDNYYKDTYYKYIADLPKRGLGDIIIFTPTDVAGGEVTVDTLKSFIEKEKIEILFVDQFSFMDDRKHAKEEREKIANISTDMKKLQVMSKIPVIAVSQQNRTKSEDSSKGTKFTQDTSQVYGSDKIGQDATTVLGIERSVDDSNGSTKYILTLNTIKARNGGDGKSLDYQIDLNEGRFTYIPKANDGYTSVEDAEALQNSFTEPVDEADVDNQQIFNS